MKFLYLIIIIFSVNLFSQEFYKKPPRPLQPAIGGESQGFLMMDYNIFDSYIKSFGMYRYGIGFARGRLGDGVGLLMSSQSGTFFSNPKNHLIVLGIEPITSIINYDTSDHYGSFYQIFPMTSIGTVLPLAYDYKLTSLVKFGFSVGNLTSSNLTPTVDWSHGHYYAINNDNGGIFFSHLESKNTNFISFGLFQRYMGVSYHKTDKQFEYIQVFIRIFNLLE